MKSILQIRMPFASKSVLGLCLIPCLLVDSGFAALSISSPAPRPRSHPSFFNEQALSALSLPFGLNRRMKADERVPISIESLIQDQHIGTVLRRRAANPTRARAVTHIGPAVEFLGGLLPPEHNAEQEARAYQIAADLMDQTFEPPRLSDNDEDGFKLKRSSRLLIYVSKRDIRQIADVMQKRLGRDSIPIAYLNSGHIPDDTSRMLAVYCDWSNLRLVAQRAEEVIVHQWRLPIPGFERVISGNPVKQEMKQCFLSAVKDYGKIHKLDYKTVLEAFSPGIRIVVQNGLDHVEILPTPSADGTWMLYVPQNRLPIPGSRITRLRFKADMISEITHRMYPGETDEKVERIALWTFTAVEGLRALVAIHFPFMDGSRFALRVVAVVRLLKHKYPSIFKWSHLEAADAFLDLTGRRDDLTQTYMDLIFKNLWNFIPHHTIREPDGTWRIRLTNPTASIYIPEDEFTIRVLRRATIRLATKDSGLRNFQKYYLDMTDGETEQIAKLFYGQEFPKNNPPKVSFVVGVQKSNLIEIPLGFVYETDSLFDVRPIVSTLNLNAAFKAAVMADRYFKKDFIYNAVLMPTFHIPHLEHHAHRFKIFGFLVPAASNPLIGRSA